VIESLKPAWLRVPAWWPRWLCFTSLMFWCLVAVFVLGFAVGWQASRPRPQTPWLEFQWLAANHTTGSTRIDLTGRYHVERLCAGRVIWRAEAIHVDGTVLSSAPSMGWPELSPGDHPYVDAIIMPATTHPTGWRIIVTVSCLGDTSEMVASPEVTVVMDRLLRRPYLEP
jgi:hypothetical protein